MVSTIDQFKSLVGAKGGIARPNLFRIKFPSLPGATAEEVNILCKDVVLPGRQIMTNERRIGIQQEKRGCGVQRTLQQYAFRSGTCHRADHYVNAKYFST